MADPVHVKLTAPMYINGSLEPAGAVVLVDLEALGVDELGEKTPGLVACDAPTEETQEEIVAAAVEAEAAPPQVEGQAKPAKPSKG